ncbi:potassium channel family protein [Kitasatospora paranensis]|uniref:Potassium channel family protein n=1 Tax=Kitasatospora paranensis TaxID=258053 RepID=A0ABW2G9B7_9ACTN
MSVRGLLGAIGLGVVYYLVPMDQPFSDETVVGLVLGLLGITLLVAWQVRQILRSRRPRLRAAEALLTTIPLFLFLFSTVYYLLERSSSGSFSEQMTRTDALYFTVTVFSTVGFGDITARSEVARVLTTGQMLGDLLLIGVAAKVLLGAVQEGMRRQSGSAPGSDPPGPPPPPPPG